MYPLLQRAKLLFEAEQAKVALFSATFLGVGVGVLTTSGDLFANRYLLYLTIALACCQTITVTAMRIQAIRLENANEFESCVPRIRQQQTLTDSLTQVGCGVLMAAPIALAPILKALCGLGVTGLSLGYIAHYCAMLLPSFLDNTTRHSLLNYAVSAAYVVSIAFGHIFPLLYLFKADWW